MDHQTGIGTGVEEEQATREMCKSIAKSIGDLESPCIYDRELRRSVANPAEGMRNAVGHRTSDLLAIPNTVCGAQ